MMRRAGCLNLGLAGRKGAAASEAADIVLPSTSWIVLPAITIARRPPHCTWCVVVGIGCLSRMIAAVWAHHTGAGALSRGHRRQSS
jgi:hypothetical protein